MIACGRSSPVTVHQARISRIDPPAVDGQPLVAAVAEEGQPLVVEAEQVQDRGVQVVDVDLVLDGVEAELVGACRR